MARNVDYRIRRDYFEYPSGISSLYRQVLLFMTMESFFVFL